MSIPEMLISLGRGGGSGGRVGCRLATLLVPLALAMTPALASAAGDERGPVIDALVLGGAKSPVLDELEDRPGFKPVDRPEAATMRPRRYDLLIVDADRFSLAELDRHALIDRFADANRWVMVLDITGRDRSAIDDHTGLTVSHGPRNGAGEMFMFGISGSDGRPRMAMVDSGPLAPLGAGRAGDRLLGKLRRDAAAAAARLAARTIEEDLADERASAARRIAARAARPACAPNPAALCADSAQVDRYSFSKSKETAVLPDGYWKGQYPIPAMWTSPAASKGQVASWKQDLWFDVGLENDDSPLGDNQAVFYESNLSFTPADGTPFFQMSKPFGFFLDPADYFLERAWWTGTADVNVAPVTATSSKVAPYPTPGSPAIPASLPQTSNGETQYSVGNEFSLSVTAAKPDGGGGATATYTYSNQQSYSVQDWSFENKSSAGGRYAWEFGARNPCDVRPGRDIFACFSGLNALEPKPASRSNIQIPTWGRWIACAPDPSNCERPLTGKEQLTFDFAAAVNVIDTYMPPAPRYGFDHKLRRHQVGPTPLRVSFDPSTVNPCPEETYTKGAACEPIEKIELFHADGSKVTNANPARVADAGTKCENEVVTGKVTLARKVDRQKTASGTKVILWSDKKNAKLVDSSPVVGNPGETTRTVLVKNGERTAEFQLRTNADGLTERNPSTEATVTAFFVNPSNQGGALPIRRSPNSSCPST